jgi:DNA repair protein RadC
MSETPPDTAGHRARLRGRLLDDPDGLQDYEIVEYLLAITIPRQDTKPLAKTLIREFGSLAGLLSAKPAELMRIKGMGESATAAIRIAGAAAVRMLKTRAAAQPVLSSWQALLDYLTADMAHIAIEKVRVLHLNARNMLIRDETMWEGTLDQSAVHVREVVKRALELGSAAIILVHNHPSGDPSPSKADIQLTRQIIDAGATVGLSVHDHVIIGARGHASLRAMGLI